MIVVVVVCVGGGRGCLLRFDKLIGCAVVICAGCIVLCAYATDGDRI